MTNTELYNLLFDGGKFSAPFLIKFSHHKLGSLCLVNNNEPIEFNDNVYQVATFKYLPPDSTGANATLSISSLPNENTLFEFIEETDDTYRLDIVGVIAKDGSVQKLKQYTHFYGSVSIDEKGNIDFQLGSDDRLDMTFTPYEYDTDNNRGNA